MANEALGAALNFGGNLLTAATGASAARKKNNILGQGIREQDRAGMESTALTSDFLNRMRGTVYNPAAERAAFSSSLTGPAVSGPGGAQFRADAAGATTGAQGYGGRMADLFARIRAPQAQRRQESELMMELGNQLRPIQMRSQDAAFLANLRAGQKQANPWLQMLGQGLSQAGGYMVENG